QDVGFRIYFDGVSASIIARYGCQYEKCNTVDALLAVLRKESAREEKRAVLSKKMLYSMEQTMNKASGRTMERKFDTPFLICAISFFAFALFALLHLIGVMLTSSRCNERSKRM
ncbi:hypothetical protein ANCCAN_14929, partial [Ancylostoma caninum]